MLHNMKSALIAFYVEGVSIWKMWSPTLHIKHIERSLLESYMHTLCCSGASFCVECLGPETGQTHIVIS